MTQKIVLCTRNLLAPEDRTANKIDTILIFVKMPISLLHARAHMKLHFVFLLNIQVISPLENEHHHSPTCPSNCQAWFPSHLSRIPQETRSLVLHMASKRCLLSLWPPCPHHRHLLPVSFQCLSHWLPRFVLVLLQCILAMRTICDVFLICHNQSGTTSRFSLVTSVHSASYQEPRTHKVWYTFSWIRKKTH